MNQVTSSLPSVIARTRPVAAESGVVGAHFLGDTAVFVLGEEVLLLAAADGGATKIAVHGGGILTSAADGDRVVTGGDDGTVKATDAAGVVTEVACDAKRRWIDHVAVASDGAVAWSVAKSALVRSGKGEERGVELPSTVGGLAFAPKGFRLAIAHYNGVSLWFPNALAAPQRLEWKGSHLGVAFSPDGKFLVTAMQESSLHGWRIADGKNMRMSGYSARVRSFAFTAGGQWLATAGSPQLVLWPFQGKDGPMGKQPKLVAPLESQAVTVACHPRQEVVAVGYADGTVLIVRLGDAAEILARAPGGGQVSALAWNARGTLLGFGTEEGAAGIIDLS